MESRPLHVMGWIAPGTWPAVVDALAERASDDRVTLVAAADTGASLPTPGLMGRGRRHDPHPESATLTRDAAEQLVRKAAERFGRPCDVRVVEGRTERVVVAASQDADRLVLARDGDRSRLGPPSLGKHTRFVIDHAPCTVVVVWPEEAPGLGTIPPPPRGH